MVNKDSQNMSLLDTESSNWTVWKWTFPNSCCWFARPEDNRTYFTKRRAFI